MKPEKQIVTFDSGSNMLKVSKRSSFLSSDEKGLLKHRTSSFRIKQSETNIIQYKFQDKELPARTSDISPIRNAKETFKTFSQIVNPTEPMVNIIPPEIAIVPIKEVKDENSTPEKKPSQSVGIPHLKKRRKESTTKFAPLVSISPADYVGVIKQMEEPYIRDKPHEKASNSIESYCAPDPFANFDQVELEKLIANIKMPESKHPKDNFRKIYREHVIQTLQSISLLKTLKCPTDKEMLPKILNLPMPENRTKTVVFDLDETFIHCMADISKATDKVMVKLPSGEEVTVMH